MSIDKIKQFVADHKKELIATTVVVGGIVLVILGCKPRGKKQATKARDIPIPEGLKVWKPLHLWAEGKYLNAIIDDIPIDDLGELGKKYIESGLAQPGDLAGIIIGIEHNK